MTREAVAKNSPILTSATRLYGLSRNARTAATSIATQVAQTKNASSTYLSDRSGISSQRGGSQVRPSRRRPRRPSHSESAPTGHRCEQNDLASTALIATMPSRIASAAGCTGCTPCPARNSRSDISAEIGRNPSTPAGRGSTGSRPSRCAPAHSANCTPISTTTAVKATCSTRRVRITGHRFGLCATVPPDTAMLAKPARPALTKVKRLALDLSQRTVAA